MAARYWTRGATVHTAGRVVTRVEGGTARENAAAARTMVRALNKTTAALDALGVWGALILVIETPA